MLRRARVFVRSLWRRREFEDNLSEELKFHLEQYTADLIRSGVPPGEAVRRARAEFGGVEQVRDDCRRARGLRVFDDAGQDARYAVRTLRRAPGFTATAVSTIALCLGANLAVFAVVNAILLRPLPYPHPEGLVRVFNAYPKAGVPDDGASVTNYYERRGALASFSGVSLCREGTALVGPAGAGELEPVMRVSPDFFATLGLGPVLGRGFLEAETNPDGGAVVILTDAFWRERYGADPAAVGQRLRVDGIDRRIVGVLPARFRFLSSTARVYLPLVSSADARSPVRRHSGSSSQMIARLEPGTTVRTAQAELDAHNAALEAGSPMATMVEAAGFRSIVAPLHAEHVAGVRPVVLLVQGGALCLLLIAAANLVNLLLIRATVRSKELAVRHAIGGSRRRIARQIVVETAVLALIGGSLGVGVGAAGIRLLAALGTRTLPLGATIAFDRALAAYGLLASLALGLALAVPVAWYSLRGLGASGLVGESRSATANTSARRLRHAFVVAQIALAFTLLSGAGLLAVSLARIVAISPGFRPQNVLTARLSIPLASYANAPERGAFVDRLTAALERQPGIAAAGIATNVPFTGRDIKSAVTVAGWTPPRGDSIRGHFSYGVAGNYFAALGSTPVEGRVLDAAEISRGDRVVVVDRDFARRYWPGQSALGRRLFAGPASGPDAEAFTVVGVVEALKQTALTDTAATGAVFFPYSSRFSSDVFIVARTGLEPARVAAPLRAAVRAADASLAISDVQTMEARIAGSLVVRRSPAVLAGLFASLALLLTAIGTYGVFSYGIAQRRREIALRMALGATPAQVSRGFVALGLRLVATGSVLGLVGAWAAGRTISTLLYDVTPSHLPTLMTVAATVAIVSIAACLVPSRRAARISPLEALNEP